MSTANKLTYLNDTKQELKQKINNLGGSIDNNTTFREYANQLQTIYDNAPKTDYEEGSNITLSNTLKGKIDFENDIVGYGQTSQEGTPTPDNPQDIEVVRGKNIWHFTNNNFVSNSNTTSNIINENKLEVTSTNTTYANTKFLLSEKGNNIYIPDGQYTFSIGKVTNTNSSMTRQMITLSTYTNGVRAVIDNIIVGTPKTITITNAPNKRYILEFWGSYDTALINTATFEEIQIEKRLTSYFLSTL